MKPYYYVLNITTGIVVLNNLGETKLKTLKEATELSEEMANKWKDCSYEILKCIGISSSPKVSTFWMDGENIQENSYRDLEHGEYIDPLTDEYETFGGVWLKYIVPLSFTINQPYRSIHSRHRRPL